jgi:hypothetical protein
MLVTVARFATPHEAHLARLRLEGAGIVAVLADENLNRIQPLLGPALGWVRVQVDADDHEAAERVLGRDDPEAVAALARLDLGPRETRARERVHVLRPLRRQLGGWSRGLLWLVLGLIALGLVGLRPG